MSHSTSFAHLGETAARVRAAVGSRPVDDETLKAAVCAYVDEAQRLGWPVERVIIEIKRLLELDDLPIHRADVFARVEGQRIVERVVTWCVEHYYRAVPRAARPTS